MHGHVLSSGSILRNGSLSGLDFEEACTPFKNVSESLEVVELRRLKTKVVDNEVNFN